MWSKKRGKQIHDDMHFMVPYEVIDAAVSDSVEEWTAAQPGSALDITKKEWCENVGVESGAKLILTGLWGTAPKCSPQTA